MTATKPGRFVWYELMTTDPEAALPFYKDVVGWTTQPFGDGAEQYTMWVGSQGPLGGTMKLPEEAKKMGAPPHWMAHVEVADVDATIAQARRHDARVYVEPTDIPKIGRFSVFADPQGATISVFKSSGDPMAPHDTSKPGEFNWNELATTDYVKAFAFYKDLFGWEQLQEHDMGPMGKYFIYGQDGKAYGGMFNKPKEMQMPPSWIYYVQVADLEGSIERAKGRGARVINGPMDVPGGTRIAQLFDPQGAMIALHADGTAKSS